MEKLLEQLGYATPFMYAAGAYGFFHWLDENASDEAKALLTRTMSFKDYKNERIASALVEVFDRIYTYPLLRWRAFFRSLLFSTIVLAIYLFETDSLAIWKWKAGDWTFWAIAFLFNIFSDYLSLFVIRPLLVRSGTKPVTGLGLGAVSGAAIVLAGNFLRTVAIAPFVIHFMQVPRDESSLPDLLYGYFFSFANLERLVSLTMKVFGAYMVFSWPALAVFAWLPLFALGILTARFLTPMSWIVGRTQWFLKGGKEHPLKAIGYVAAVVVFLGAVAGRAVFSA